MHCTVGWCTAVQNMEEIGSSCDPGPGGLPHCHCTLHVAHLVLHTSYCTPRIAHFILHTSYCTLHIAHFKLNTSSSTLNTNRSSHLGIHKQTNAWYNALTEHSTIQTATVCHQKPWNHRLNTHHASSQILAHIQPLDLLILPLQLVALYLHKSRL